MRRRDAFAIWAARLMPMLWHLLVLPAAIAAEPVSLQLELGAHSAAVLRIAPVAGTNLALTVSHDKTIRYWSLLDGRPLRAVRVPGSAGSEGRLQALAVSPDGRTAVVGGALKRRDDEANSLLVLDIETARLARRSAGGPGFVRDLAYSPDGQLLAAASDDGLRIWRARDFSLLHDVKLGAAAHRLAFSEEGRLVVLRRSETGAGALHVFEARSAKELMRRDLPPGDDPHSLSVSRSGSWIAVGIRETPVVTLFAGKDLSPGARLALAGTELMGFIVTGWSADGETLYAGGRSNTSRLTRLYRWQAPDFAERKSADAGTNSVASIAPVERGTMLFATWGPELGLLAKDGRAVWKVESAVRWAWSARSHLRSSEEGEIIELASPQGGGRLTRLSLATLALETVEAGEAMPGLLAPLRGAPGLDLRNWRERRDTTLNGKPLALNEESRSAAVVPDGSGLVIGSDFNIRFVGKNGKIRWRRGIDANPVDLVVLPRPKLVLAVGGDGLLRWLRLADGAVVLTAFIHADERRWAAWTPSGYYAASAGADSFVGWHLNAGLSGLPEHIPLARFRDDRYRPDVVTDVLRRGSETEALAAAGLSAEPPGDLQGRSVPQVVLTTPSEGSDALGRDIVVDYLVRAPPNDPVTSLRVLVGERVVRTLKRGELPEGSEARGSLELEIPGEDTVISLIAENRSGTATPASVALRWRGSAAQPQELPMLYVLAVGVGRYEREEMRLAFAAKDARDLAASLLAQKGGLYRGVEVKLLTDEAATKDAILDGLEWIERETTSRDVAMVFIAGHGVQDANGVYYFLPVNADPERLKRTALPYTDVKTTLENLNGRKILFVDTCHSGSVMGGATRRAVGLDLNRLVNDLIAAENATIVYTASTGRQFALEKAEWRNGAFTLALIEGLAGAAATDSRKITISSLDYYIAERVKRLTLSQQTPTMVRRELTPDFPIALKR